METRESKSIQWGSEFLYNMLLYRTTNAFLMLYIWLPLIAIFLVYFNQGIKYACKFRTNNVRTDGR